MLKEHYKIFRRMMILSDLVIVAGAFFLGYLLRDKIHYIYRLDLIPEKELLKNIYPLSTYMGLLPILLVIWGALLYYFGMYRSFRVKRISEVLFVIFKTTLAGFILFASFTYVLKLHYISRTLIIFIFALAAALISVEKVTLIQFFRYIRKKGYNFRNILIVGTGKRARRFIELINKHAEWGLKIIGFVDEDTNKTGQIVNGYKVIGSFRDMPDIIHNNVIDEIVFVVPRSWLKKVEDIMHFCEEEGKKISIAVDYFELRFSKAKQTDLHGFPLLTFESTPDKLWHLWVKRLFDIVFSFIALIILAPIFAIVAIMIKATSKGPVFFKQERGGLNGRKFMLYKFRTMVVDAEAKLKDVLAYNEMDGPVFKLTNDPRLTKVGKFLRKFSVDELPQLWNVLKEDMSIVGPRPPIPAEIDKYANWQRRRLSMMPGITCLWQVKGRNNIDFEAWMRFDLEYIDNWSLWLDCKIILQTIPVVLFGIGGK